jgi:hypothetical protein
MGKNAKAGMRTHLSCYILREAVDLGRIGVGHGELHRGRNLLRRQHFLQSSFVRSSHSGGEGTTREG